MKSANAAKIKRTMKKTRGKTDSTKLISIKSIFLSRSSNGTISVIPPETKKFRKVIVSIRFKCLSARYGKFYLNTVRLAFS